MKIYLTVTPKTKWDWNYPPFAQDCVIYHVGYFVSPELALEALQRQFSDAPIIKKFPNGQVLVFGNREFAIIEMVAA